MTGTGKSTSGISRTGAFPYPGSKGLLATWIIDHLPAHHAYVEPFGGSAAVLCQKPESNVEVINDTDGDIVHFYRILRDRRNELEEWLRDTPFSRDLHRKYSREYYAGYRPENDIERAGRWYYIRSTQFAQKYTGASGFRSAQTRNHSREYHNRLDKLDTVADRLRNVQLENRDYVELLERFDADDTVFYLDPPYVDAGDDLYSHDTFDHTRLVEALDGLEAKWLVSYTELPLGLKKDRHIVENDRRGTMRAGQGEWEQENTERLVMNFDPAHTPKFVDDSTRQETLVAATDGGEPSGKSAPGTDRKE